MTKLPEKCVHLGQAEGPGIANTGSRTQPECLPTAQEAEKKKVKNRELI